MTHTIPSPSYSLSPIRTGYEYVLPSKVPNSFSAVAEQEGTITSLTENNLTITYKDGTTKSFTIGDTYGEIEGVSYLHKLITDLKVGSKVKKGQSLYWHKDFFEKDPLFPEHLVFKTSKVVTVGFELSSATYEDSSAVSHKLFDDVTTTVLQERRFMLDFDSIIENMVSPGDEVGPNTTLFINREETVGANNLSENTLTLLESLAAHSPRAKYKGKISHFEIKYNGDISDMHPSIQKLARQLDKELYAKTKGTSYEAKNNRVSGEYTSKGQKLNLDSFELKVFIEVKLGLGVGDKLVLANQAKTVIGEVYPYTMTALESGEEVMLKFSYFGFLNRMIGSPELMGTSNRLIRLFMKKTMTEYLSKRSKP